MSGWHAGFVELGESLERYVNAGPPPVVIRSLEEFEARFGTHAEHLADARNYARYAADRLRRRLGLPMPARGPHTRLVVNDEWLDQLRVYRDELRLQTIYEIPSRFVGSMPSVY